MNQSKAKILTRMEKGDFERRDFCSYLFEQKEELGLTDWNLAGYANVLIMAGSETSAALLSGLTYHLCRTREAYKRLKDEVRGRFKTADEITSQTATFPYLTAVIQEALRIFPPSPIAAPRITPKAGGMVAGVFVPGGVGFVSTESFKSLTILQTTVGVNMWSVTHNPNNFKDPYVFRPERWLDPNCTDNLSASQPFLLGPRACMGQK